VCRGPTLDAVFQIQVVLIVLIDPIRHSRCRAKRPCRFLDGIAAPEPNTGIDAIGFTLGIAYLAVFEGFGETFPSLRALPCGPSCGGGTPAPWGV
jgi:hypothetical protein